MGGHKPVRVQASLHLLLVDVSYSIEFDWLRRDKGNKRRLHASLNSSDEWRKGENHLVPLPVPFDLSTPFLEQIVVLPASLLSSRSGSLRDSGSSGRVGRREPWERGWMETTLSVEQGTNLSKQKNDTKTIGLKAISSILVFNIEVSFQRERLRDPCVKLHSLFSRQ